MHRIPVSSPPAPLVPPVLRATALVFAALLAGGCGDDEDASSNPADSGIDVTSDAGGDTVSPSDTVGDDDALDPVDGTDAEEPDDTTLTPDTEETPDSAADADDATIDAGADTGADAATAEDAAGDAEPDGDTSEGGPEPVVSLVSLNGADGPALGSIYRAESTGTAFNDFEIWRAGDFEFPIASGSDANLLADVDGDGLDDVVALTGANGPAMGFIVVYLAGDGGFDEPTAWRRGSPESPVGAGSHNFAGDVDGDGLADLVAFSGGTPPNWGGITYYRSTGSGFETSVRALGGTPEAPVFAGSSATLSGDVNADGLMDIVALSGAMPPNWGGARAFLGNGSGFDASATWYSGTPEAPIGAGSSATLLGDVTGDGRDDLVMLSGAAPPNWGTVSVVASTGSGFSSPAIWFGGRPEAPAGAGGSANLLADVNNDGLADLIAVTGAAPPSWGTVVVYLSNGTGFDAPTTWFGGRPEAPVIAGTAATLAGVLSFSAE